MQWLRLLALLLAFVGIALLAGSGLGTRAGLWDYRIGLSMLRYAVYAGIAAVVLTMLVLAITRPRGGVLVALVVALTLGVVTAAVPYSFARKARAVPPIHDITTDTADPPAFVAILPLREGAPNRADYAGDSIAVLQKDAYADVQPLDVSAPAAATFTRALDAAREMGWEIVAADSTAGRIEGTATTTWFGFKDDVVVRVRAIGAGSRVDVRSVSRVGRSDVGANAARIRAYLASLAR
ncbi:MAG: DUF1499 domain-containing protein [Gemmatimonadota bacterium]